MPAPEPLTRACTSSRPRGVTRQSSCQSTFSIECVHTSVNAATDSVLTTPAEARQRLKPPPPRCADAAAIARARRRRASAKPAVSLKAKSPSRQSAAAKATTRSSQRQPREQEADRDHAEQADRDQRLEGRKRHRAVESELGGHRIAGLQHQRRRIDEDERNDIAGERDAHRLPADLVGIFLRDRRRRQRRQRHRRREVGHDAVVEREHVADDQRARRAWRAPARPARR